MSGLAAVLAGRRTSGVYLWHAAFEVAEVRHAVEHVGWQFGHVDGWRRSDKVGVLTAVGEALGFPDYYRGRSLDALWDCLTDVAEPTVLLWDGWGTLAREDEVTFAKVRGILEERAALAPPFTTLLRGEGPEIDVPSLD
ncbi:barstar family protein [Nocardioides dilutus]